MLNNLISNSHHYTAPKVRETNTKASVKAWVYLNLSEMLVSLREVERGKGFWNTTRQLPERIMEPQVVGQLFGVSLPIFNFKL